VPETSAARRRRSNLAVPASNPRMIERAAGSQADQVFLDLEDACAPAEKKSARTNVVSALLELDFGTKVRAVRINDVTTRWCHADIVEVVTGAGAELDGIVVPKVEDASHVHFVDHLLAGLERELGLARRIGLELQIESPTGAVNLREIARASGRVETIIFGPGDYAVALGVAQFDIGMVDRRYPGHQWHWVMAEIAAHARSVGAQAIDGPYVDFGDEAGYRESAQLARLMGYDGKWCIHPNQLDWANEAFAPTAAELQQATRILAAYAEAEEAGLGATALDGKLIDEATRKLAEQTVARVGETGPAAGPPAGRSAP
jgi:citrate lyase subunit beta / citryl-CoA lyase